MKIQEMITKGETIRFSFNLLIKAKEIDAVRQWLREAGYPSDLIFYQAKYTGCIPKYLIPL